MNSLCWAEVETGGASTLLETDGASTLLWGPATVPGPAGADARMVDGGTVHGVVGGGHARMPPGPLQSCEEN